MADGLWRYFFKLMGGGGGLLVESANEIKVGIISQERVPKKK